MIAPATGIKRQFYAALAQYLSQNGFGVITYDNNGIGDSLQGQIKNNGASLQSWGEIDMPAVLSALQTNFPQVKYHLIGHSAGGQLAGLMPNANELTSMLNFASSSGRIRNMKFPFRLYARFFMSVFIPFSNGLFGHTKAHWVGMGEALPKMVARQWSEWCNGQGYVKTGFGKTIDRHWYDELDFPSLWINATDDDIAIDENVGDMLAVFTRLKVERLTLDPTDYGLKEIGHMKFFSRKNKVLWKIALEWLGRH